LPKQAFGRPQFRLSLSDLWCVLVDKQVAKFLEGNEWSIFHGLHISLSFIGKILPKRDLIKTLKFEFIFYFYFFWRISITKSEGGKKNSKNSQIYIFGFEWVAKDRKG
jgi:hypothetical protein